jgi:hypothetical protein
MFKVLLLLLVFTVPEEDTIPLPIKDPVEEAREEMENALAKIKEADIKKAHEHQKKVVEALDNAIKLNQKDPPPDGGGGGGGGKQGQKKSSSKKGMGKENKRSSMSKLTKSVAGGNNPESGISGSADFNLTHRDRLKMEAKIWGDLNKKEENEQKVSLLKEEFLPIYSPEIEAYYKEISDNNKRLSK